MPTTQRCLFVTLIDSVISLLKLLNEFNECSGLEINNTKTEAMWLGEWKDKTDEPFGFKWPKEPINALGVSFSYNHANADRLNFGEKILSLEKTLKHLETEKLDSLWKNQHSQNTWDIQIDLFSLRAASSSSLYPRNQ